MSFEARVKYLESATGQVYYLWQDEESGKWLVGAFAGGPEGVETVADFAEKDSAQTYLVSLGCNPT